MHRSFRGVRIPIHRNVVNLPAQRSEGRGIPPGQPRPPSQVEEIAAKAARRTEGVQLRAFSHKAALPPLVSLGLSPDEHFVDAIEIVAGAPLPAKEAFMMDEDFKFAAAMTVKNRSKMK